MSSYLKQIFNPKRTPQNAPIPGTNQVRNSAGGYSFPVDEWKRMHRFLILGSEGGSYYATERALTVENTNSVLTCLQNDGVRVVREVVTISDAGRAPKNDPAIFVLALAAGLGDETTRRAALDAIPQVCRTGTHLFQFVEMVQGVRGWGRGLRRGIAKWYQGHEARSLAYQLVKYRQRNGWTHTDTLRLSHPNPVSETHGALYQWVTKRDEAEWARALTPPTDEALAFVWAFERVQAAESLDTVLKLIADYRLPREALPTQWLNEAAVWEALLADMPMTAMLRNLGTMGKVGLLKAHSRAAQLVVERLGDAERLRKARIHPIAVLSAHRVYARGRGVRGDGVWSPVTQVVNALDDAFYLAFGAVEPTHQRHLLALDISGSMTWGEIAGVPGLTPRVASAAMALVTARVEPQYEIVAFSHQMTPVSLSHKMRLDDVVRTTEQIPMGGTDCALPMIYARENDIPVDVFVIYTDSQTYYNPAIHPVQALREYREAMDIGAKLIVVGLVSNNFSIADPNDAGMLDVVGFDSAAPGVMSDFARGRV